MLAVIRFPCPSGGIDPSKGASMHSSWSTVPSCNAVLRSCLHDSIVDDCCCSTVKIFHFLLFEGWSICQDFPYGGVKMEVKLERKETGLEEC